ncbi:hypothetical protein E3J84_04450 [Candidatus Aerophobetes bacterium]|uniref:Uncharacterized protein n=1 Tax=Aerophobetes bacterium TaxID=2030807 RepID=A0A523RWT9_UNCAE|nr:MAG: hypothetical protein E3J84_04450 [Candidatus Aerophobetes bacterium]
MELGKFEVLENKIRRLVEDYSQMAERNMRLEDKLEARRKETGKLNEKKAVAARKAKRLIKVLDELKLPGE